MNLCLSVCLLFLVNKEGGREGGRKGRRDKGDELTEERVPYTASPKNTEGDGFLYYM